MPLITLERVTKIYPPYFRALNNISLSIEPGEFVLLTGPTGAGKTTLLKLIYREEEPTDGEIFWEGLPYSSLSYNDFLKIRRKMGIIFQDLKLFEDLSVYENIKLSLDLAEISLPKKRAEVIIYDYLERFDLSLKANKKVKFLSGGEKQKVGFIRAIIRDPDYIIADEPTGNIDPLSIKEILSILKELNQKGKTVLLATHDPIIIQQVEAKEIYLHKGELIPKC
ncbi:MAG: ATP-binding cassette domain-containing protein [Caldimicrobium sp.]|jgi:cell division transport system ATP-binding protein|nr:ATP-binding cassette domain-containing protein [Caldimicrobium sp.]